MAQAAAINRPGPTPAAPAVEAPQQRELTDALPLYVASLVVTLAGLGAVGVTYTTSQTPPLWILLTVLGHGLSYWLRRSRVPADTIFWPVMLVGTVVVGQLALGGSALLGLDQPASSMPADMVTATLIASIAVVRTFTLLSNGSLLFSPVPPITMLALVASSNPNAEVPLFFGLLVLGSLFITSYEAHLRRVARTGRRASPVLYHLLACWCVTLAVSLVAILFPLLLQPVLAPLSPFALPVMGRLRPFRSFTQTSSTQSPVGQGPIRLSPVPVFEVYTPEGGLLRTSTLSVYNGRSWNLESPPLATSWQSDRRVAAGGAAPGSGSIRNMRFAFRFPDDPDRRQPVPVRRVPQRVRTVGYASEGVPALGRISELFYSKPQVSLHISGTVMGTGHQSVGQSFEVVSEIPDFPADGLRQAPPVDPVAWDDPETLSVPQSTLPLQQIARRVTARAGNAYDKVQAITGYIERTCRYTLEEEPTPAGEDAAVFYLTQTKRGACSLSSTAAALMCRTAGIPARVAIGYVLEEPLQDGGGYMVRQHHLHMWLEAFFPGYGWVPFNPSPPMADIRENPLLLAMDRIQGAFRRIGGGGLDAFLLVALVGLTLALAGGNLVTRFRTWRAAREREAAIARGPVPGAVALVYGRAVRLLERRGFGREAWMTPQEYHDWLRAQWTAPDQSPALAPWERLTDAYQRARYGGETGQELLATASAALAELERVAPSRAVPRQGGGFRRRWFGAARGAA